MQESSGGQGHQNGDASDGGPRWHVRVRRALKRLLQLRKRAGRPNRGQSVRAIAAAEAETAFETGGTEAVRAWCARATESAPDRELVWTEAAFKVLRPGDPRAALEYGERLIALEGGAKFASSVSSLCQHVGDLSRALELIEGVLPPSSAYDERVARLEGQLRILNEGLDLGTANSKPVYPPVSRRVLYLLHASLPYSTAGYSTRSQGLIKALRGLDYDVIGVSRLGFPWDQKEGANQEIPTHETIDDVPYVRLSPLADEFRKQPVDSYIETFSERIIELAQDYKPALLHAASNFVVGAATVRAAHRLGIPSIYEVRGLWEYSTVAQLPYRADSDLFKLYVKAETQVAQEADAVLAITSAVKDVLVERGVSAEKIKILPNGVDPKNFRPLQADAELRSRLGLDGKVVIGYVGSITAYEGLDDLLRAIARLDATHRDKLACVIVGDGAYLEQLKELSESLGLGTTVHFAGRVPHQEVSRYYSVIDIAPFPRKGLTVCELVSPLKPFEAMAMEKTVICSDVAALAEIVQDGRTGLLHRKDDPESLANCIKKLLDDPALRQRLGKTGRQWVEQERD